MRPARPNCIAFLAIVAAVISCSPRSGLEAELAGEVGIHVQLARILAEGDERGLAEYSETMGFDALWSAYDPVHRAIAGETPEELWTATERLLPVLTLLAQRLAKDYCCQAQLDECRFLEDLSPEDAFRRRTLLARASASRTDTTLTTEDRIRIREEVFEELKALGDLYRIGPLRAVTGLQYTLLDDPKPREYIRALEEGIALCREAGDPFWQSHFLGLLGYRHRNEGGVEDSAWACYERSEQIAEECRLGYLAARMQSFKGALATDQGRIALGEALKEEAPRTARRLKAGKRFELHLLIYAINAGTRLGAWSKCEAQIERGKILLAAEWHHGEEHKANLSYSLQKIEARILFARGKYREGDELYERLVPWAREAYGDAVFPDFYWNWASDLTRANEFEKAIQKAETGLRRSIENKYNFRIPRIRLEKAHAQFRFGKLDAARTTVLEVPDEELDLLEVARKQSLLARIVLTQGDRKRASDILLRVLEDIHYGIRSFDGSQQASLAMAPTRMFKEGLHELVGQDPEASLELEMAWRRWMALHASLPSRWALLNRDQARAELSSLIESGRGGPVDRSDSNDLPGILQWVYSELDDRMIRWVSSSSGVTRDTLDLSPNEIRERVESLLPELSAEPSTDEIAPTLTQALEEFAEALLPSGSTTPDLILITPDGPLASFPFEALDWTRDGDYLPILSEHDVAYLRFDARPTTAELDDDTPLVVVDPVISDRVKSRHPFLAPLRFAREEGRRVATLLEDATLLEGSDATKEALRTHWERSSILYVAAHVVRDVESPYLSFIPMAPGGSVELDLYLDSIDIREADLSGCKLVVLPSCSSGAPYVSYTSSAPSLGDAFLDAGARSVVLTFWDIRDDTSLELMRGFQDHWLREGLDPVISLNRAKRKYMIVDDELKHPFYWSSFFIRLGGLDALQAGS